MFCIVFFFKKKHYFDPFLLSLITIPLDLRLCISRLIIRACLTSTWVSSGLASFSPAISIPSGPLVISPYHSKFSRNFNSYQLIPHFLNSLFFSSSSLRYLCSTGILAAFLVFCFMLFIFILEAGLSPSSLRNKLTF